MARLKKQVSKKKSQQGIGEKLFNQVFDSSTLPSNDPALQALRAHSEGESFLTLEETLDPRPTKQPKISLHFYKTLRFPIHLGHQAKYHSVNLIFCLIFVALGFSLSELYIILKSESLIFQVPMLTRQDQQNEIKVSVKEAPQENQNLGTEFIVQSEMLNIRRGPGATFEIVGQLKKGERIKGEVHNEKWVQINQEQFVYHPSLKVYEGNSKSNLLTYWTTEPQTTIYMDKDLESEVLGQLEYASEIKGILEGEWFNLENNGFLLVDSLSIAEPFVLRDGSSLAQIKVSRAPIRLGPGVQYKVVGLFFEGKVIRVKSLQNGWAMIDEGQYVKASFLNPAATQSTVSANQLDKQSTNQVAK